MSLSWTSALKKGCYILAKEDFYNRTTLLLLVSVLTCCYILAKEDFYNLRWSKPEFQVLELLYPRKRGLLQLLREFRSSLVLSCYILAKEDFYNVYKYRPYTLTYEVVISSQKRTSTTDREAWKRIVETMLSYPRKRGLLQPSQDILRLMNTSCHILTKEDFYNCR